MTRTKSGWRARKMHCLGCDKEGWPTQGDAGKRIESIKASGDGRSRRAYRCGYGLWHTTTQPMWWQRVMTLPDVPCAPVLPVGEWVAAVEEAVMVAIILASPGAVLPDASAVRGRYGLSPKSVKRLVRRLTARGLLTRQQMRDGTTVYVRAALAGDTGVT